MVQGKLSNTNFSNVRMFESYQAVLMRGPAVVRGTEIHFAPGAFQPHSESGRKLIEDSLVSVVCAMRPAPIPYPSLSSSSQSSPSHSNVMPPTKLQRKPVSTLSDL